MRPTKDRNKNFLKLLLCLQSFALETVILKMDSEGKKDKNNRKWKKREKEKKKLRVVPFQTRFQKTPYV
jgi:hypothetical protein